MIETIGRTGPLARLTAIAVGILAALCLSASSAQALTPHGFAGGSVPAKATVHGPPSRHLTGATATGTGQALTCVGATRDTGGSWETFWSTCGYGGASSALAVDHYYGNTIRANVYNPESSAKVISGTWYEDTAALWGGETLGPGASRVSRNGQYGVTMQYDGNLVLYKWNGKVCWHTNSNGHPGNVARMQADGNFVVYGAGVPVGGTPYYYASGTWNQPGAYLLMQNDGNLVIYNGGYAQWWTGTNGC